MPAPMPINPDDPLVVLLRGHLPELFFGPVFLFVGLCACIVAALRHRGGFRVLLWFGLFIGMAGTRILATAATTFGLTHESTGPIRVGTFIDYFLVVPGALFWAELSIGKLRRFIQWLAALGASAGLLSLLWFAATGRPYRFIVLNSLVAISMLLVITMVVAIPALSRKYLIVQSYVLSIALPLIAFASLFSAASRALGHEAPAFFVPAALTLWIVALGYVAVQRTFDNERRLLTIESELETARRIQFSILPERVPELPRLRIAAGYHPMSAVAGDFYQFLESGDHDLGVLVADVAGHGVPAALIAAMMKTAVQSVASCAPSPREVLQGLNRTLSAARSGQLVTAGYLFLDTDNYKARYSAAGHPLLLLSRAGTVQRIESNGLVFGVVADPEYPVREMELCAGDRLLLYTDGLIEPENVNGEAFGERRLDEVMRTHRALPPPDFLQRILFELQEWRHGAPQQDDITLIVMDVL